jgi:hypothetical protein
MRGSPKLILTMIANMNGVNLTNPSHQERWAFSCIGKRHSFSLKFWYIGGLSIQCECVLLAWYRLGEGQKGKMKQVPDRDSYKKTENITSMTSLTALMENEVPTFVANIMYPGSICINGCWMYMNRVDSDGQSSKSSRGRQIIRNVTNCI